MYALECITAFDFAILGKRVDAIGHYPNEMFIVTGTGENLFLIIDIREKMANDKRDSLLLVNIALLGGQRNLVVTEFESHIIITDAGITSNQAIQIQIECKLWLRRNKSID